MSPGFRPWATAASSSTSTSMCGMVVSRDAWASAIPGMSLIFPAISLAFSSRTARSGPLTRTTIASLVPVSTSFTRSRR